MSTEKCFIANITKHGLQGMWIVFLGVYEAVPGDSIINSRRYWVIKDTVFMGEVPLKKYRGHF